MYCWCTLDGRDCTRGFRCCTLLYSVFDVVFVDHGEQREVDTEAVVHTGCYSCRVFAGVPYSSIVQSITIQPVSQSTSQSVSTKTSSNLKPSLPRLLSAISQYHADHTAFTAFVVCSLADIIPAQTSHTDCQEVRHSCLTCIPAYIQTHTMRTYMRTYMHPLHTVYPHKAAYRIFRYFTL